MDAIGTFNDKLRAGGHFITAEGIESGANATVTDNRAGAGVVVTGSPYSQAERYTGFWLIEAADQAQAHALAHEASLACNRKVEVRAYLVP